MFILESNYKAEKRDIEFVHEFGTFNKAINRSFIMCYIYI